MSGVNNDFPRLLMLLRKEKGYSQKKVAEDLGLSQALLSHYEKGIRECGLDFVVRAADYFGVSCDYLLGRSAQRNGSIVLRQSSDLAEGPSAEARAMLWDSGYILFSLLEKINSENLTKEVTDYIACAVYKMFRVIYTANARNPQGIFSLDPRLTGAAVEACMAMSEAKSRAALSGDRSGRGKRPAAPELNPDVIAKEFPNLSPALFELIRRVEDAVRET